MFLPALLVVAPSSTTVQFSAAANKFALDQSATLTASLNGGSQSVTLSLTASAPR
jgi:hypothetical protein